MSCDCNTLIVGEAGPQGSQGLAGTNGTNGTNGINAFTTTTASFTQPSNTIDSVSVTVADNRWIATNQPIYISGAGFYRVTTVSGSPYTNIVCVLVKTDGISGGASVSSGRKVSASSVAVYTDPINQLTVNGSSVLDGAVTINDSGADKDFRVEGDTDTHLLFTDASANRVGISTNVPETTLHVEGDVKIGTSAVPGDLTVTKASTFNSTNSATGDLNVLSSSGSSLLFCDVSTSKIGVKNTSPSVEFDVTGDVEITGSLKADLASNTFVVETTNHRVGIGTASPSVTLDVTGDTKVSGNLTVDTSTLFVNSSSNYVGIGTTSPTVALDVSGAVKVSGDFTVDTSTLVVNSSTNYIGIRTSSPTVELDVTGAAKISGNLSVDTSTLFVDSSSNYVGIGTTSPAAQLDVAGSIRSSSMLSSTNLQVNTSLFVVDSAISAVKVNNNSQTETFSVNGSVRFYNGDVIFKTGSTETLYYDATNHRIGIGTVAPTEKLDVVGNAKVSGNLTVDTSTFYVNATNNYVGIKTSSPTVELDVVGSVKASDYRIGDGSITNDAKLTRFVFKATTIASVSSIAANSTLVTAGITVTGADLGDFVQVSYATLPVTTFKDVVVMSGYVSTTDTVVIIFANNSTGAPTAQTNLPLNILVTRAVAV